MYIYWPCCKYFASSHAKRREKMLKRGTDRIEAALDTRKLFDMQNHFATKLETEMSHMARKLLRLQRRDTVLELSESQESD